MCITHKDSKSTHMREAMRGGGRGIPGRCVSVCGSACANGSRMNDKVGHSAYLISIGRAYDTSDTVDTPYTIGDMHISARNTSKAGESVDAGVTSGSFESSNGYAILGCDTSNVMGASGHPVLVSGTIGVANGATTSQ